MPPLTGPLFEQADLPVIPLGPWVQGSQLLPMTNSPPPPSAHTGPYPSYGNARPRHLLFTRFCIPPQYRISRMSPCNWGRLSSVRADTGRPRSKFRHLGIRKRSSEQIAVLRCCGVAVLQSERWWRQEEKDQMKSDKEMPNAKVQKANN